MRSFKLFILLTAFSLVGGKTDAQVYDTSFFDGQKLTVFLEENALSFAPYGEDLIRIALHHGADTAYPNSLSIVLQPQGTATVEENEDGLIFQSGRFSILLHKDPFAFSVITGNDTVIAGGNAYRSGESSRMEMETDPGLAWYGGGSRAIPMDRNGRSLVMLNRPDYGYGWETELLNISIPVVVNNGDFGLYFENPSPGTLSLGGEVPGWISYHAETGPLSCFVFASDTLGGLMDPYTRLTGRQPLPPLWALGYIQSRFGYENEQEAREVVRLMTEQGFPLDAIIFDLQWQGGVPLMGNLSWDLSRFPDPGEMMADFRSQGVKSICIIDPYFTQQCQHYPYLAVKDHFAFNAQGDPYVLDDFWAGPAGLIDVTDSLAMEWFWQHYRFHTSNGVEGWWSDLGEPELVPDDMHFEGGSAKEIRQTYNLRWSELLFEKFLDEYPGKRLFNLTRSGYAGMQRYGAIPWSGDVQKTYGGLRAQIPIMLGMGLSGSGYMSSDIGGFTGAMDAELYTRWQQMGAFTPIMRAHGTGVPTEPVYYPDPYRSIVKDFIRLRYRMLPYNYTLLRENSMSGIPPARPLSFYDDLLTQADEEYFWGRDLLVAPVLAPEATSREVAFPAGRWIDFFRLYSYEGGQTLSIPVTLGYLPVFARAGAMIPMLRDVNNTATYDGSNYLVRYFPDPAIPAGSATIYMDDGITREYHEQEAYSVISLQAEYDPDATLISMERTGSRYAGEQLTKVMEFEILRCTEEPGVILFNGNGIMTATDPDEYMSSQEAGYFDPELQNLMVKVTWDTQQEGLLEIHGLEIGTSFGIPEKHVASMLDLYPNPLTDHSKITVVNEGPGQFLLTLSDLQGRIIAAHWVNYLHRGTRTHNWYQIFPGQPAPGMYILTLTGPSGQRSLKVLVK